MKMIFKAARPVSRPLIKGKLTGIFLLSALLLLTSLQSAVAQITLLEPAGDSKVKACDDFATAVLGDPWDMSNSSDVNYFLPSDISALNSISWTGGAFSFTTAAPNSGTFYLLSPLIGVPIVGGGRYGSLLNIDTAKYHQLSIRMYTDTLDSGGIKLIWNRAADYVVQRTVTTMIPTRPGWHTYRIDLNSLAISGGESSDTRPWSAGSITGLAIQPQQQGGARVSIDWIRLEDPASCATASVDFRASTSGSSNRVNVYLDDDGNLSNGYYAKLATAAAADGSTRSAAISTSAMAPGNYKTVAILSGDYATLVRDDGWDFAQSTDVKVTSGVGNAAYGNSGMTGTTTAAASASVFIDIPSAGIDAGAYRYLSFKLTRGENGLFNIFWTNPDGAGYVGMVVDPAVADADHDNVYKVDLGLQPNWRGTVREVILRPSNASGIPFNLIFVSLGAGGYVDTLPAPAPVVSSGNVKVNHAPLLNIESPSHKSGEAIRPWNMNSGDFVLFANLRSDADPAHTGEPYTAYLPDVRYVEGLRGDFFKGTNVLGSDDPNNFLTFPLFNANPLSFAAAHYPNICFKLFIDHPFDLCLGSMSRVIWQDQAGVNFESKDIVLISDNWSGSRWYEYCVDMSTVPTTINTSGWNGTVASVRVDAHEFSRDTCGAGGVPSGNPTSTSYYFDYVKLRKDSQTRGNRYVVTYDLADSDGADTPTLSLYYNTSRSTSGGTLIVSGLPKGHRSYVWDTSAVPAGTYYVYGVANDGTNSVASQATGRLTVDPGAPLGAAPVLTIQAPVSGDTVCDSLQVKGYGLQTDRFEDLAGVTVSIDGQPLDLIHPGVYSPDARSSYPGADSSNSGFDRLYDLSGISAGAHTVSITALSRDGQSTTLPAINVTKAASNCAPLKSDPLPAGSVVGVGDIAVTTPTPAPVTPTPKAGPAAPVIGSVKHSANGVLKFSITKASESGLKCSNTVLVGTAANNVKKSVKSFSTTKTKLALQASKVSVNPKKIKTFYLAAKKTCPGLSPVTSAATKVKVKTKGSIASLSALTKQLKTLKASP